MTSPEMKKAPVGAGAINNRTTNYQKEETMNTSIPRKSAQFEATIHVAGLTVSPGVMSGGTEPDETVVTLRTPDGLLSFTPAEACALAAALQAVAVHVMESTEVERKAA